MKILLLLAMTACLQNVDSTALDGGNGHSHFLELVAQPQVLKIDNEVLASQATITEMTLADRQPSSAEQKLEASTSFNDAGPLKFSKIVFNFTVGDKKHECTLPKGEDVGEIKLSQKIPFSLSACQCEGCDNGSDPPPPLQNSPHSNSFSKCEKLLTHILRSYYVIGNYTITKIYKDDKSSCDRKLYIGWYESVARELMRASIENRNHVSTTSGAGLPSVGSFDAAVAFINKTGITCKRSGDEDLKLIFPASKEGKSIGEINLICPNSGADEKPEQYVRIGLSAADSNELLITIMSESSNGTVYDAYDTNDKGQIIKHVQVDASGQKSTKHEIKE